MSWVGSRSTARKPRCTGVLTAVGDFIYFRCVHRNVHCAKWSVSRHCGDARFFAIISLYSDASHPTRAVAMCSWRDLAFLRLLMRYVLILPVHVGDTAKNKHFFLSIFTNLFLRFFRDSCDWPRFHVDTSTQTPSINPAPWTGLT